jgi:hypothetical protein
VAANRALAVAKTIQDTGFKATRLSRAAQTLAQMEERDNAFPALRLASTRARMENRRKVFSILEEQADLLAALDQDATLWQVYEAIQEVDSWWGAS